MFNEDHKQWIGWGLMAAIFAAIYYLEVYNPTILFLLITGLILCGISHITNSPFRFGMSSYFLSHAIWLLMGMENTREWLFHLIMAVLSIPIAGIVGEIYFLSESKKENKNQENLSSDLSKSHKKIPNEKKQNKIFVCTYCGSEFTHQPNVCPGCGQRNFTEVQD